MKELVLSSLNKTWIFDIDGTLVKQNGCLMDRDELLPGVKEFFNTISDTDYILLLTAREQIFSSITEEFLRNNGIRYNRIIYEIPTGERILFNDIKVSGLITAIAVSCVRNAGLAEVKTVIDNSL